MANSTATKNTKTEQVQTAETTPVTSEKEQLMAQIKAQREALKALQEQKKAITQKEIDSRPEHEKASDNLSTYITKASRQVKKAESAEDLTKVIQLIKQTAREAQTATSVALPATWEEGKGPRSSTEVLAVEIKSRLDLLAEMAERCEFESVAAGAAAIEKQVETLKKALNGTSK